MINKHSNIYAVIASDPNYVVNDALKHLYENNIYAAYHCLQEHQNNKRMISIVDSAIEATLAFKQNEPKK